MTKSHKNDFTKINFILWTTTDTFLYGKKLLYNAVELCIVPSTPLPRCQEGGSHWLLLLCRWQHCLLLLLWQLIWLKEHSITSGDVGGVRIVTLAVTAIGLSIFTFRVEKRGAKWGFRAETWAVGPHRLHPQHGWTSLNQFYTSLIRSEPVYESEQQTTKLEWWTKWRFWAKTWAIGQHRLHPQHGWSSPNQFDPV